MKQTFKTATVVIAVLLAAMSCTKEIEAPMASEGCVNICIQGAINDLTPAAEVKSTAGSVVRVNWEEGDTVYVYDGSKYLGALKVSLKDGDSRYAILSNDGTIDSPKSGTTKLTLIHVSNAAQAPAVIDGQIKIDLSNQEGDNFPYVLYGTLDYTSGQTTITDEFVPFKFATSVIKVNCTGLKPGTAITSATLSNVNTACKLTLSGTAAPSVSGDINGTITRTGDEYSAATKVNEEGVTVFQIAAPKLEEASEVRVLTVAQGSNEFEYKNFSKKALSAATSVNTVCQLVKALPAGALPGVFTVSPEGKKVHFSQGNLTYDVEATTNKWKFYEHQYDRADDGSASTTLISLFTWGYGDWSTRPNGTDYQTGDFTDWGSQIGDSNTWSTLSTTEWQYLFNTRTMANGGARFENLTSSGITVEGVTFKGAVLFPDDFTDQADWKTKYKTWKALNDAGIVFLPAAGGRYGSDVDNVGFSGLYWSSTASGSDFAYRVSFTSRSVISDSYEGRFFGYSVRLITECQ